MAKVKKIGTKYCVTHDTTGAVLKRKGRRVCFATQGAARKDARATIKRITGR